MICLIVARQGCRALLQAYHNSAATNQQFISVGARQKWQRQTLFFNPGTDVTGPFHDITQVGLDGFDYLKVDFDKQTVDVAFTDKLRLFFPPRDASAAQYKNFCQRYWNVFITPAMLFFHRRHQAKLCCKKMFQYGIFVRTWSKTRVVTIRMQCVPKPDDRIYRSRRQKK